MKFLFLSVITVLVFSGGGVFAQEMDMEEAMKLAKPGVAHEMLSRLEGEYNIIFKYWMQLDAEPMSGTGTAVNKMILGGRFLESKSVTEVMGENKESIQTLGYDNRIKKHTYYAIDEFGTYGIYSDGDYNENAKTITYYGVDSLSSPGMKMNYKIIVNMSIENGYVMEVHFQGPDENYARVVEVTHTRK